MRKEVGVPERRTLHLSARFCQGPNCPETGPWVLAVVATPREMVCCGGVLTSYPT